MGALANQSVPGPGYGPRGLEQEEMRQVALVDRHGRVAAPTGRRCIRQAGHRVADGVSAQANIMARLTVPAAMVDAYPGARGDLADRLLAALEAAEAQGGEARRLLHSAYSDHEGWRELLRRLPAAGRFPEDPALLDHLV